MFSGLVEATAQIVALLEEPGGVRLVLERPSEFTDVRLGDSIAIQGCCLTVVELDESRFSFQAGRETLSRTSLGERKAGDQVNCERSLKLGDRLGGHLVTGHIDGQGALVVARRRSGVVDDGVPCAGCIAAADGFERFGRD
jgi:riboflavin synthase